MIPLTIIYFSLDPRKTDSFRAAHTHNPFDPNHRIILTVNTYDQATDLDIKNIKPSVGLIEVYHHHHPIPIAANVALWVHQHTTRYHASYHVPLYAIVPPKKDREFSKEISRLHEQNILRRRPIIHDDTFTTSIETILLALSSPKTNL